MITALAGADATELTFEQVMDAIAVAESPVEFSIQRNEVVVEKKKPKAQMAPRRMPTAKKMVKASTNVKFWQDPVMIGSVAFTVIAPLGVFLASKMN